MNREITIISLDELPLDDLQPLLAESQEQGFEFVDRLAAEYVAGINQFQRPGEVLFGVYWGQQLIAIGGLNRDPYSQEEDVGRVRHVYVLSAWRNQGIGKQLVERIIGEARPHFRILTLRTFSQQAAYFYEALGFRTAPGIDNATHHVVVDNQRGELVGPAICGQKS
jgi:GNAT superfamily N-acetyltransferase